MCYTLISLSGNGNTLGLSIPAMSSRQIAKNLVMLIWYMCSGKPNKRKEDTSTISLAKRNLRKKTLSISNTLNRRTSSNEIPPTSSPLYQNPQQRTTKPKRKRNLHRLQHPSRWSPNHP